jgi:hypothetical protein
MSGNEFHCSNQLAPLSEIEPPVIAEQFVANAGDVNEGVDDNKIALNTTSANRLKIGIRFCASDVGRSIRGD